MKNLSLCFLLMFMPWKTTECLIQQICITCAFPLLPSYGTATSLTFNSHINIDNAAPSLIMFCTPQLPYVSNFSDIKRCQKKKKKSESVITQFTPRNTKKSYNKKRHMHSHTQMCKCTHTHSCSLHVHVYTPHFHDYKA